MNQESKQSPHHENIKKCTLYVCKSCRTAGTPREPRENRQGFVLYQKLREAIAVSPLQHQVNVQPAECLSVCPRPCGVTLSSNGAWTYIFGDQKDIQTIPDIIECVSLYLRTTNGFMPRGERPKSLRSSILGRVPPRQGESTCT